MEITNDIKTRILAAIRENRENYPSDNKHSAALGISASVYNAIKKGVTDRQVSDANWICIARRLNVALGSSIEWQTAETDTFKFITGQMELCQLSGISSILCDRPNIGKTYTAKVYVQTHKNAVYVDCSQVKSKQRLIRFIAKEFGISTNGRYCDVYDDLTFYLRTLPNPLIILDEAGDLENSAFLELKALWNATDRSCGWYMMGADGLRALIKRRISAEKVGYTEMFSRYGDKFNSVTPDDEKERKAFLMRQAAQVIMVNTDGVDVMKIVNSTGGSLRRVYTEIEKMRSQQ